MIPPPQPPQEATDIFSISDQVLADRLQFIEEVRVPSASLTGSSKRERTYGIMRRSASETGAASGYADRRASRRRPASCKTTRSPSSSYIGPRRLPLLRVYDHCTPRSSLHWSSYEMTRICVQMERNEDGQVAETGASPFHHPILLLHYHALICPHHHVNPIFPFLLFYALCTN